MLITVTRIEGDLLGFSSVRDLGGQRRLVSKSSICAARASRTSAISTHGFPHAVGDRRYFQSARDKCVTRPNFVGGAANASESSPAHLQTGVVRFLVPAGRRQHLWRDVRVISIRTMTLTLFQRHRSPGCVQSGCRDAGRCGSDGEAYPAISRSWQPRP